MKKMSSGHVNHKGKRRTQGGGIWQSEVTYEYVSPGVTLPNEYKKGEKLAELSSGVTITQLSKTETEKYLKNRRIGKLSKVRRED